MHGNLVSFSGSRLSPSPQPALAASSLSPPAHTHSLSHLLVGQVKTKTRAEHCVLDSTPTPAMQGSSISQGLSHSHSHSLNSYSHTLKHSHPRTHAHTRHPSPLASLSTRFRSTVSVIAPIGISTWLLLMLSLSLSLLDHRLSSRRSLL